MVDKKSVHKPRHVRQTTARAIRRNLSNVTPENSHPQKACPLFSVLPSEIRNLIFEFALSQTPNANRPINAHSRIYRPGHTHFPTLSTSLLRTCRLIYYETQSMPLRGATHHMYQFLNIPIYPVMHNLSNLDQHLFHLSSQQGAHLYHLHHTMSLPGVSRLHKYIRSGCEHLMWKKITWTVKSSLWSSYVQAHITASIDLVASLLMVTLPPSCEEVNLELECLDNDVERKAFLGFHAEKCRKVALRRREDGESGADEALRFDEAGSKEYIWMGTQIDYGDEGEKLLTWVNYYVIRLCWRSGVPRREYMHLDRLDCLTSNLMKDVERQSI